MSGELSEKFAVSRRDRAEVPDVLNGVVNRHQACEPITREW